MVVDRDSEFLASLRVMVDDVAPQIAPLSAATVIPAARRRVAKRRSLVTGAFGVVLLTGAGLTQVLPATNTPTMVMSVESDSLARDSVGTMADENTVSGRGVIAPLEQGLDAAEQSVLTADDPVPASSDLDTVMVEAAPGATNPGNPWTVPLLATGLTTLGAAAVIAARAPKPITTR